MKISTYVITATIMILAGIANLANGFFTEDGLLFQIAGALFILGGGIYFYTGSKKKKEKS